MELGTLQDIVRMLANQCHVRYWVHWNYPNKQPWLMAINTIGNKVQESGFLERGFTKNLRDEQIYWTIERTNKDGTPFDTSLY